MPDFLSGPEFTRPHGEAVSGELGADPNHEITIRSEIPVGRMGGLHILRIRRQYVGGPSGFAFSGTSEGHFHYVSDESRDLRLVIPPSGVDVPLLSDNEALVTRRPCPYQDVFTYIETSVAKVSLSGFNVTYQVRGKKYRQFIPDRVISRPLT